MTVLLVVVVGFVLVGIVGFVANGPWMKRHEQALAALTAVPGFRATHRFIDADAQVAIAIDQVTKKVCFATPGTRPVTKLVDYKDVLRAEIVEDGETRTVTSVRTERALLGAAAFGAIGFLAGALTADKTSSTRVSRLELKVIINDASRPLYMLNFLPGSCERTSRAFKDAQHDITTWHARIAAIVSEADDDEAALVAVNGSRADELAKLARLRDQGVITEAEFAIEKARVLTTGSA
jgi:hypothetical protein